jgi:hypothetical protein
MCEDDDDLGKTPGRAPIGQEELGFFSTLKVDDDPYEEPKERRAGIAEPSASGWAEVDAQQPDRCVRPRAGTWVAAISVVMILALAGLLLMQSC